MTIKQKSGPPDSVIPESDSRWRLAERVSRSSTLYRAVQLRQMLQYIVRHAILYPDEPLNEFEIAHHVLGRRKDFNPVVDNIVRVQMAHLRKKLDLYFSSEGKDEEVVMTIALGTYKPLFNPRAKPILVPHGGVSVPANQMESASRALATETVPTVSDPAQKSTPVSGRVRVGRLAVWLALLFFAAGCLVLWLRVRDLNHALDLTRGSVSPWRSQPAMVDLWSSFLDSNRETDVVLSDDSLLLIEEIGRQEVSFDGYLNRSYLSSAENENANPTVRSIEELVASKSLGNSSEFKLAERVLELDPVNKHLHLYSGRQYMPALAKQDNLVLIGGRISNPWSGLFESRLNFVEYTKFEGIGTTYVQNRAPVQGEPQVYQSTTGVGYCVVAYLPNPGHDGKVLLIEGTSSESTEAAGDFLLSADQFSAFRNLLGTSPLPYFEVLLRTSQVRGTPLTASVEAYRVYRALR